MRAEVEPYRQLCRARRDHIVEVREPLVLISQVQRSGGTLLSQLFDGHAECHAHPHELKIGYPAKWNWPRLDLADPERSFARLDEGAGRHRVEGYRKSPRDDGDVFPFLFLPELQRTIFLDCVARRPIESERDLLDCYMTSFFNAWLDNHNLYSGPKRVVTGFVPQLSADLDNVERLFSAYPDGMLISIVRDPRAWYDSSRRHIRRFEGVEAAMELWLRSTRAALAASERFAGRVLVIAYERLVQEPEATMSRIAEAIGITMSSQLLFPSFNGRPIRANSVDPVEQYGILPERATAYRDSLDATTIAQIDAIAGELHQLAAGAGSTLCEPVPGPRL
jgi:LPS sulfotransferase NodH